MSITCNICGTIFVPHHHAVKYCSKECSLIKGKQHQKTYRDSNKELTSQRAKKYNQENPEKIKSNHYRIRYGITLEKARALLDAQGGRCAICKKELDFDNGERGRGQPVVDHCHSSNKVRGMLCTNCNLMLGYSLDKKEILQTAINYLEKQN